MNYSWDIKHIYNNDLFEQKKLDMNLSDEEFDNFINHKGKLRNPFKLKNMDKLVDRVQQAILNNEKIMIAGDYDVDGISATTIMMLGLLQLNANVFYRVPSRIKDGYGLSVSMVDEAKEKDATLIITVDNGIACHDSIAYANNIGIDVIVTDHHPWNTDVLPSDIVVDPFIDENYEFPYICGAMVAYKAVRALIPELKKMNADINNQMIALAAIATIADVMPLQDENRIFVYNGLKLVNKTSNYGLNFLLKHLNISRDLVESDVGFSIAPCINAVGRLEDASQLVEMLLSDSEYEADVLAQKAVKLNEKRKALTKQLMEQVEVDDSPVIVQVFDKVPNGLLGIIANKISHKYQRPCFAMVGSKYGYGGSGRSVYGYDISQNIFLNKDLGVTGGGHAEACALSVNNNALEEFKSRCNANYLEFLENADTTSQPTLYIDFEIAFDNINFDLINQIDCFKPFGQGNEGLTFCTKHVQVLENKVIGKAKNALKLKLRDGFTELDAICFNELKDYYVDNFMDTNFIDIVYTININEYMGRKNIQLMPIDFKLP